jgi:Periplasmic binding protein
MPARSLRRAAIVVALVLIAAACSSSSKSGGSSSTTKAGGANAANTASAKGVTADTIKLGLSYPDLEALAKQGLIKVDNGDYAKIGQVLVDDINKNGGVNGRKIELAIAKYSVLEPSAQTAACTQLTEDDKVFLILGGFIAENNLCAIQQHATPVIFGYGAGFNQIILAKAKAPFTTYEASDERSTGALIKLLDQQGSLKGKKIGLYGTLATAKPLLDLTKTDLEAAGYQVTDSAVNDVPASDVQAFNAQDKLIGNRFMDKGVDTVFVQVTVPPGANWDAIGFHPSMYSPQASLVTSGAFTNGYDKFPLVAGVQANANDNVSLDSAAFRHCREVWKAATGLEVTTPAEEAKSGKSTGFAAMGTICTALQMFVEGAKKAGGNLTPETWLNGLESVGKIELAASPIASFAPNKPDGQDSFQLVKYNPAYKPDTGVAQLLPVGGQITFTG